MVNKSKKNEKTKTIARSPQFVKLYATNTKVFSTDVDIRFSIFNEKFEDEDEEVFVSDGMVILTPECAKKLLNELGEAVSAYEEKYGEIKISIIRQKKLEKDSEKA